MKAYKVKATVIKDFNDSKNNNKHYEINDVAELDRYRYEELLAKGFVSKGEIIKPEKKKKEEEIIED